MMWQTKVKKLTGKGSDFVGKPGSQHIEKIKNWFFIISLFHFSISTDLKGKKFNFALHHIGNF